MESKAELAWMIREMKESDLQEVDALFALAFETFMNAPGRFNGLSFSTRYYYVDRALVCEHEGRLIGAMFMVQWGDTSSFGPVGVHPDFWGKAIAQAMLDRALEGCGRITAFTFPASPKHHHLYMKYGVWPEQLLYVMAGSPDQVLQAGSLSEPVQALAAQRFSNLDEPGKEAALLDVRDLFFRAVREGFEPSKEVAAVDTRSFGDTILLYDSAVAAPALVGVAILHAGDGPNEAGPDTCLIKLGAAQSEEVMCGLLRAVAAFAVENGCKVIELGVCLHHRAMLLLVKRLGFKVHIPGLQISREVDDTPSQAKRDVFLIADYR